MLRDIKNKNGEFETVNISDLPENQYHEDSVMECVFENGKIKRTKKVKIE